MQQEDASPDVEGVVTVVREQKGVLDTRRTPCVHRLSFRVAEWVAYVESRIVTAVAMKIPNVLIERLSE